MAAGGGKEGPRLQFNDAATADIDLLIYTPSSSITIKLHSVVVREVAGVFREFATMEPQRCKQWKPLKVKDMGLTKIDNYQGRDNMMLYTCEADNVPGRHYLQIIGEEKKRAKDYVSLFRFMYSSYYGEKLIFEDVDDPRHLLETAYALGFYDLVGQYLHGNVDFSLNENIIAVSAVSSRIKTHLEAIQPQLKVMELQVQLCKDLFNGCESALGGVAR